MTNNNSLDLVIFDCDGVLVDSESITMRTLIDACEPHGLTLDLSEAMHLFRGGHWGMVIEEIESRLGHAVPDTFTDDFRSALFRALDEHVEPVPGIKDVLGDLPYRCCVASNGPRAKMATTLRKIGLLDYFEDRIYSAYDIDVFKPNPDLFLHAAREMGATPERCAVIEDSSNGIRAARAANMRAIAYVPNGEPTPFIALGAEVIRSMDVLLPTLDQEPKRSQPDPAS